MTRNPTEQPGDRPPEDGRPAGRRAAGAADSWPVPSVPAQETLVRRFRAVAARFGDRLAVHGPSGAWTYRELDARSDALAARIRAVAGRGERVALLYGHDIKVVAAVLAVLKAGAAYLPLDPQQPTAQLAAAVTGTDPALILTDAAHATAAERPAEGRPVLAVADDDGPAQPPFEPHEPHEADEADEADGTRDALACVLHTSGLTGAPQEVGLTDRGLLTRALAFAQRLGLGAEDRVPMLAQCAFDGPAPELFGALLAGASLHVINPWAAPPATLLGELVRQRATVLPCTPALLRLFIAQLEAGAPAPEPRAIVLDGKLDGELDGEGSRTPIWRAWHATSPARSWSTVPAPVRWRARWRCGAGRCRPRRRCCSAPIRRCGTRQWWPARTVRPATA